MNKQVLKGLLTRVCEETRAISWRDVPRFLIWLGKILISRNSLIAIRITLVSLAINICVFFAVMRDRTVCYIAIMEYLIHTVAASHSHVGSVFRGGLVMAVAGLIGSVLALVSLAMADGSGIALYFIMLVCCFLIAVIRLNPHLTPMGILVNFMYGATLIFTVKTSPSRAWFVIYPTLLSAVWSGAAAALAGLCIFPKLARTQLRLNVAQNLSRSADILERIASFVLNAESKKENLSFTAVEDCYAIHTSLLYTRTFVPLIPFEPDILHPFREESSILWDTLIKDVDQLVVYIEAVAGILRRQRVVSKGSFQMLTNGSVDTLKDYCDHLCKLLRSLAECLKTGSDPSQLEKLPNDLRYYINKEIANIFEQFWTNSYSRSTRQLPSSLESVSVIFFSYSLRTFDDGVSKIFEDIQGIYRKRQERGNIWKNLFSWLEIIWEPVEVYKRSPQLLRDTDNLKFLFRQVLSVAIIIVPSILVAGVSEADYNFTQDYNAVSAYIMVIIIYMRGVELTWYRLLFYCLTTVISSALAYAATMFAGEDPYILTLWMGLWIYAALVPTLYFPSYIIADLGFVFGQFFTVSCQYGNNFTFVYPASRVVSVFAGCFVVGVVSAVFWPFEASKDCQKTLVDIMDKEKQLFCDFIDHFVLCNQQASTEGWTPTIEVAERLNLIEGQLTKLRTVTNLDPSIGFTHPSLPKMLQAVSSIFRRLVCMKVALSSKPELTGKYLTTVWNKYLSHMNEQYELLKSSTTDVFDSISKRLALKSSHRGDTSEIEESHERLFYAYENLFGEFRKLRIYLIEEVSNFGIRKSLDNLSELTLWDNQFPLHPDDAVRHLTFLYSLFQVLDTIDNIVLVGISLKPGIESPRVWNSISQSIRNSIEPSDRALSHQGSTSEGYDDGSVNREERRVSFRQDSSVFEDIREEKKLTLEMGYYKV
ncbi:hypothetical protein GpartN1_g657.t1 [Galdieria partita]|uniref:Uncharacterized protein n=1 Tax=Galdieria partita TaxID=83374 RepID=A0A9C7PS66_9RHOD|nr:hypothetical protein GpartN1_g657.t1 [Galdieria partita]